MAACDGTSLTAVDNAAEISDTAVLGAKPPRVLINEIASSGWSGKASYRVTKGGDLAVRITAYGPPTTNAAVCLMPTFGTLCYSITTNKAGRASYSGQLYYTPGSSSTFQIKQSATLLAESPVVVWP